MSAQDFFAAAFDRLVNAINAVDAKTGGGGGASNAHAVHAKEPGLVAGSYISQAINATALSTIAGAANRLDFFPFIPARDVTINELALEVSTLLAGSTARVGIYGALANGQPGAFIVGSGALDCATVGAKVAAIANTVLTAGTIYYLAVASSGTQTYRGVAVAALQSLGHAATGTAVYTLRRATSTFANGFPANAPATVLTSAIAPRVLLKLAA